MDPNPYDPPLATNANDLRRNRADTTSLRTAVAALLIALVIQWVCHFLTAGAMMGWMRMVSGAPTSKTLDSVFLGFGCVAFTAALSLGVGIYGAKTLLDSVSRKSS